MKKVFILSLALPLIFLTACSNNKDNSQNTQAMDNFAECLTENGVKMYGTATCPHCAAQKAEFGSSFEKINYIECSTNPQKCIDAGITGVPTWEFSDGTKIQGEQKLSSLGEKAWCEFPEER